MERRPKCSRAPALSPVSRGCARGETPVGEAQFAVYSPGVGLFSLLAAGNGNVSFLEVLSVLSRTLPWLIACVWAGRYMWK